MNSDTNNMNIDTNNLKCPLCNDNCIKPPNYKWVAWMICRCGGNHNKYYISYNEYAKYYILTFIEGNTDDGFHINDGQYFIEICNNTYTLKQRGDDSINIDLDTNLVGKELVEYGMAIITLL